MKKQQHIFKQNYKKPVQVITHTRVLLSFSYIGSIEKTVMSKNVIPIFWGDFRFKVSCVQKSVS